MLNRFATRPSPAQTLDSPLDSPLWLDRPDAAQLASVANVSEEARQAAMDLITRGITILRGVQDPAVCQATIEDYQRFCAHHPDAHAESIDETGRERRLVNFHHYSDAAMQLGANPRIMEILDFLFGAEACVYTSLTFKFSTQQPVHRDTPHFATWPDGYFFGVWTALEDISPDAGPLFYYEGAHRFTVDHEAIWQRVCNEHPDMPRAEALDMALDIYNGEIMQRAPEHGTYRTTDLKRGDIAIWHPQLPHGGSGANELMRSRWSTVFHCAPRDKQVHQHDSFFTHAGREAPADRYTYRDYNGRAVALAGDVAFQF